MSCFPCLSKKATRKVDSPSGEGPSNASYMTSSPHFDVENHKVRKSAEVVPYKENGNTIGAHIFSFRELAIATKNFRPQCLIGEGGFGRVYKGQLSTGQGVAVKQLDRSGLQGNKEFFVEVLMLSLLHHPNLVNLIGYCADGDQRLLVYEYMSLGSLEDHLLDVSPEQRPLDWYTRMKIALDAANGLDYLHNKANPPVIYRDLKSSNILLDKDFHAKLSDFGLAKLGPIGDQAYVSTRVMGTYGYCAPEYQLTGQLTAKSDVYSFGVVLLELITGKRAIEIRRPNHEEHLVTWATPVLRDASRHRELADPLLRDDFPMKGLNQAVAIASMCLQEDASLRPVMCDVATALGYLTNVATDADTPALSGSTSNDDFCTASEEFSQCESNSNHDEERQRATADSSECDSKHSSTSFESQKTNDSGFSTHP